MSDRTKSRLVTVAIIVAIVFLWLWLRRVPAVQKAIQQTANDLGLPELGALLPLEIPGLEFGDDGGMVYDPRDAVLPPLSKTEPRYTSCNFCLQSRVEIAPAAPPAKITPPSPTPVYPAPRYSTMSVSWSPPPPKPSNNWGPTGLPMGMGYIPGIFG